MGKAKQDINRPWFARAYTWMAQKAAERGEDEFRKEMLAGLRGRVIEVGAGNGLNFAFYPEGVDEVLAVEPEPHMREMAREAASQAPVEVKVVDGIADGLPAEDSSFDAGVASLVLCSVPEQASALRELRRVIRPSGELRFYEHVVAHRPVAAFWQKLADATFWPRVSGGCHLSRDTGSAIEAAGFEMEEVRRFPFASCRFTPSIPHILGRARRP